MYLDHFKLREMPFSLTPGTRFVHFSPGHRSAIDHLLFGIRQRKGFIVLVGEVGSGKTTLCRALLRELESTYQTALILNPRLSEGQLLRAILNELGVSDVRGDLLAMRDRLNAHLLEQAERGNDVVLIIDEAQTLSAAMLENIRLLTNLETEDRKLLQIVLVGQPELRTRLNDHRLRQLRQRVSVYYHLRGMGPDDTARYVAHRLSVAGAGEHPRFDPQALALVHEFAQGIPRQVNTACDMALLAAFSRGEVDVGEAAVRGAVEELQGIGQ